MTALTATVILLKTINENVRNLFFFLCVFILCFVGNVSEQPDAKVQRRLRLRTEIQVASTARL